MMELRWTMSVVVSLMRLQQSVRAISGVFLSSGKVLIDGVDIQAKNAVVVSMEDLLLFAGSSGKLYSGCIDGRFAVFFWIFRCRCGGASMEE